MTNDHQNPPIAIRHARALFPARYIYPSTLALEMLLAPSLMFLGMVMAYRDTLNELYR